MICPICNKLIIETYSTAYSNIFECIPCEYYAKYYNDKLINEEYILNQTFYFVDYETEITTIGEINKPFNSSLKINKIFNSSLKINKIFSFEQIKKLQILK